MLQRYTHKLLDLGGRMATLAEQVAVASEVLTTISTRITIPVLILLGGVILGKIVHTSLLRFLSSVELDKKGTSWFRKQAEVGELIAGGVAAVINTIAVVWALVVAGIITEALIVVGAVLLILAGFSLFLGVRDFLPDFFAGFSVRPKVADGKKITVSGVTGKVERVGLLDVRLQTKEGLNIVIPHRTMKKSV